MIVTTQNLLILLFGFLGGIVAFIAYSDWLGRQPIPRWELDAMEQKRRFWRELKEIKEKKK